MKMFWDDSRSRPFQLILILILYLFATVICVVESKIDGQNVGALTLQDSTKSPTHLRSPTSRKLQSDSSKSDDHHDENDHQQIPDSPSDDEDEEKEEKEEKKRPHHPQRNEKVGPNPTPDEELKEAIQNAEHFADDTLNFWHAFVASVSVIIVSELGDKTFFIAAIMAMRHSRLTVFVGAIAALGLMTVLSSCLGYATQIIPRRFTYYASTILFALFGVKMLKEGWEMRPDEAQEEFEEAQTEVLKREEEYDKLAQTSDYDLETGTKSSSGPHSPKWKLIFRFVSKIFLEAFTLTFLAEWGDRSQLTTIILAARENVFGVTIGGILGHSICTGFAVLGGRFIAQRISVRTVTLVGGVVFIVFALSALVMNPDAS